ncbi:hypothetical protein A3H85_03835 [Candidatus Daviesbacteria bacterium RIFCSPLOWO2_02_FULL_40_8]|uniref:PsbP C-terminal domain-containing protein n=1 Tax=Candidatus Daviesbacteria bacterium RIFCSPLOWO2_01_FULL_40_24 TaxID=1797787 RepID=A0A1F5MJZ4_9BACT|nr:MAG: hypothetical protein A2780_02120 [Candidatus Daviesbacteria bacterium RIFCSPHIGHO2_01_FULL_41_45]OGE34376.1 MAG: hypothetical protein A3C32_02170 [Candidatus Daviesbacteria bacterium RIFCSPHIGHO2_02_FULL_41_14]OGE65694.1 MAG: hypothetical protein A3B49_03970 [Candidatus Daviesbacteria bacterium RIFCSPLOWO2_01_FULL_40_24]OGE66102.1 MAG: hypothetical protein A3H85_03835 [Candidatus Daviesbacteria bacterium RIFCSPLOWO2_02_FULL_40_8]
MKGFAPAWILVGVFILVATGGGFLWGRNTSLSFPINAPVLNIPLSPTGGVPRSDSSDETASWKVYTNLTYKFSVKYPQDWELVPFISPDIIPAFKPSNDQNYKEAYRSAFGVYPACLIDIYPKVVTLQFEEWIKIEAATEIQGLTEVRSLDKIKTNSGVEIYNVLWSTIGVRGPEDPVRIAYIRLPTPVNKYACLEFSFGDPKYEGVSTQALKTFKFN